MDEIKPAADVTTLMTNYRAAVTVSDKTRQDFLVMGQTQTASSKLGLDQELKKNALLRCT